MNPEIVIAPYRCREESQEELFEVLRNKRKYFLEAGYVTERMPVTLRSFNDREVILEIFEWSSSKATEDAHRDPVVREYWNRMSALCSSIGFKLSEIQESTESFPHFEPLNIYK